MASNNLPADRRAADLTYQAVTVVAMLLLLSSLWLF